MTIVYFIIALGILVAIHEFGHFIAAKKQGIGVEKFSIGFGPTLIAFKRGETEYKLSLLPFGGYVKLMGEEVPEKGSPEETDRRFYSTRPLWQKCIVVVAGPAMNLFLAAVLLPIVFMLGRMQPIYFDQPATILGVRAESPAASLNLQKGDVITRIDDLEVTAWKPALDFILLHPDKEITITWKRGAEVLSQKVTTSSSPETHAGILGIEPSYFVGNDPIIDNIAPGSAAEEGGLVKQDRIVMLNNQPLQTWTDMVDQVAKSEGKALTMVVSRDGKDVPLTVTPRFDEGRKRWVMGVEKDISKHQEFFVNKQYGFGEAIGMGLKETAKLSEMTLSVLGRLLTLDLNYKALGGPIKIAEASGKAAESGLSDFFYFLAFLSVQLGVLNLLPFPVLDGGHLVYFGIEAISGKPVSIRLRNVIDQIGFFALISLMALVTLNDISGLKFVRTIWDKIVGV